MLFNAIRYAGAAYLIYLGIKGIFFSDNKTALQGATKPSKNSQHFLAQGFLCNVLNPKTMLFFLSVFSQVISTDTSNNHIALIYGGYMIAMHCLWFSLVAMLFTSKALQTRLLNMKKRLNQLCGVGLVTFGTVLALKS